MANTPSVISVGKKVMREGFCSIWIKDKDPCMVTPNGIVVPLVCDRDVPYIKSDDIRRVSRDHDCDFRRRCGVIVKDNHIVITVPIQEDSAACPGPAVSADDPDSSTSPGAKSGEEATSVEHDHEKPSKDKTASKDGTAEVDSESDVARQYSCP